MTIEIIIQAVISGLLMGCIYALIAAGLSLIFGLMGIVNFAHGEHLMLSMFFSFWLWILLGLDPIFSLPIVLDSRPNKFWKNGSSKDKSLLLLGSYFWYCCLWEGSR